MNNVQSEQNGEAYDHGKYLILWKTENGQMEKIPRLS